MSRIVDVEPLDCLAWKDGEHGTTFDDGVLWVLEKIGELPTIERKTGRWIDHTEDGYVECPFCHSATNCDDNIDELHFCFSCGAKMEVEE